MTAKIIVGCKKELFFRKQDNKNAVTSKSLQEEFFWYKHLKNYQQPGQSLKLKISLTN